MSGFWYEDANVPGNFTAAGGVAGLGEIVDAAAKQMALVDNSNAASIAMTQAYDDRIAAIKAATGQGLENPIRQAQADLSAKIGTIDPALAKPQQADWASEQLGPPMPTSIERHGQDFTNRLRALQQQYPQFSDVIRADVPIERDAAALAKSADERLNILSSTRSLVPQLAANLVGGFEGSLNDPLTVSTMFLGGGASEGRTLLARIGNVALKEALINGAVTASMQPDVQAWREKAGLPHGFDEGLKNTLFAATIGAGLGSAGEVIGHVLGRAGGHVGPLTGEVLDATAEALRQKANLRPDINAALAGDHDAALTALRPIRDALAPEARAAIDLHESISAARDSVPNVGSPTVHQANMDAAQNIASDPSRVFEPQLDPAKVDRIVSELVPDAPAPRKSDRQSLAEFLIRAGGLKDQGGELRALDMQNLSQKYVGRLVKDSGRPLDNAREIAAEAGFFNHIYGTPEEAMAKSTVADLLDELSNEGNRPVDARPDDGGRSYVEQRVTELMQQVGPEVDDKLIGKAVQLAESEKIGLVEAFDRVALEAQAGHVIKLDNPHRLSDAEHAALDALIEKEIRQKTPLTPEEQALIDRAYAENGPASPELNALIARGLVPAPRDLIVHRGETRAPLTADEFASTTFSRDTARNFAAGEATQRHVIKAGTPVYSPRSGISGGEILIRQGELDAIRPDDPLALPTPEPEPSAMPDEALFTPDDLEGIDTHEDIPFFDDGTAVTGQEMIDDMEELHGLFQLTEACKA